MEKYNVNLENNIIDIYVEKKKIKNTYLQFKDYKIIIKTPNKLNSKILDKIILKNKIWILDKNNIIINKKNTNENEIMYLGDIYIIKYTKNTTTQYSINKNNKEIQVSFNLKDKLFNIQQIKEYIYLKESEKLLESIFNEMILLTHLKPEKVIIKNLKSAWGNCKSNKNITINPKVFMFEIDIIKYVIVHELCHLKEMNHSANFWNLVEKYIPNYKILRKNMKNCNIY